jgi:apolipoprotein N-acyltransferase
MQALRDFVEQTHSSILLGAVSFSYPHAPTNSLFGFTPYHEALYRYDKIHLVPFGEFVPWGFDTLLQRLNINLGNFSRGASSQPVFFVRDQALALGICYEDIFGEEIARTLRRSSSPISMLVNSTNLGWFGNTIALDQHLQMARMRALETGRPILRATNTGVTAAIDHHGHVIAKLPVFTLGVLQAKVQGMIGSTPYIVYGNLLALAFSIGVITLLAWRVRKEKARRNRKACPLL